MVEHGNLVDYVLGLDKTIGVGTSASYALVSSFATDLGNTVIFSSLLLGGSLHIISKQNVSSSNYLVQYFKNYAIDCLKIVPSHYKALCNETLLLPNKFLIFGGEALPTQLVKRIISARPSCKIINHYGPTETTIGKLLHVVDTEAQYGQTIPLGMPFSNTGVVIMSNDMQVCPAGIPGQLFIAGAGVARGYLNNEELTNQKFINLPVGTRTVRMYATGDLVKTLHTGDIEFIGRVDDQVKIRGYRVELGEIENILRQCNGVELCAVIAKEDKGGEKKLVAYVTSNGSISTHNIEQYLQAALPDYMVPGAIIELDEMPLMINGKIDKKALPDPDMQQNATTGFVAPDTEVELRMATIWCDILEEEIIGVHDDFFALGGHSLLAVRLISAIRKEFKIEIPISHVFDFPTIALLAAELNNQTDVNLLPPVMVVVNKPKLLPLSFSQERLWFIDKLQGSIQYHIPAVLSIKGSLNIPALQFALQSIVNRHEVLRTIFLEQNGQPYQKVKDGGKWHLLLKDGKDFLGNKNLLRHYVQEIINKAFDLSIDDMLRAELISLNSEEFVLVITVHHIASDGWSRSVLVKECEELYNTFSQDNRVTLAPLLVQYSDYAIWQRNYLEGNELDKKVKYWKNALAGMEPLNLPVDFARLPIQSTKGAVYNFIIDNELSHSLNRLSTQNGATNFMLMLAAFKLLLRGYTGQADICVGTPVAGRQQQELEGLIGFFVNTLALRTNLTSANNFIEVLSLVKQTTMSAYEHQDLPFEKVVEAVVENRDLSRTPIFQVLFGMQNTPAVAAVHLQNLEVKQEPIEHATSKFDLGITLLETETGICASVEYCPDLFRKETIEQIMRHYRQLLSEIVRLPDQNLSKIKMLTEAEHQQLIVNGLGRQTTYQKDKMLIHMFEEQVNKTPDNVAVVFNEGRFTYRQLNESANQLAHYLQSKGVTADTLVPICIDRSVEMIVGILGIMKAGGAYVPIDPSYPQERVQFILGDTCAKLVISDSVSKVHLPEQSVVEVIEVGGGQEYLQQQPTHNPAVTATIQSLAYIIYTSGSTGQPKGVKVKHSSLVNYLVNSKTNYVDPSSNNTGSYIHLSFTFDASITALFMPLLAGKSVVISSTEGVNVFEDENFLAYAPYDFLKVTPAHLELLKCIEVNTEEGWITNKLVVGGEALYPSQFNHFYNQDIEVEVINEYGPTEATVGCIVFNFKTVRDYHQIQNGIPIGKPIDNTSIYILDKANNLVPKGAAGEICISGQGLAQGYVNRDDLNAEKFIEHSFVEGVTTRIYKTGDYGRWLTDGNIEYIGRQDDQVKIMGYRVELGEIENTILQSGMINQASVITKSDKENNKRLIAYIVCKKGFDANNIKEHCKVVLPKYMQPASWVTIDHMPLTISGKIDRKALPAFDFAEMATANDVGPQTDTEIKLVNIWKELLAIEKVGVNNSFFELGGHSLMVMRMVSAIKKQFSLAVPIPVLFQFTTIKELGEYLDWQLNTVANEPSETLEVINL